MEQKTILVVDDEPQIQRFLRHALQAAGYTVRTVESGAGALKVLSSDPVDLVVLDLGLSDLDGKVVLGQLRQGSDVPVVVLSARDDEDEKVAALDLGANDYVEKPFGIGEFLARIRVLLRKSRTTVADSGTLSLGPLQIDRTAHRVVKSGQVIKLTPKEFELLGLLAAHTGRVLTHRQILKEIWGAAHVEDVAYLRVFIGQLRQKIEDRPSDPQLIVTVPGVGYRASIHDR